MQNKEKEITKEEAINILGEKAEEILRISELTVFCSNCIPLDHASTAIGMEMDKYWLDKSGDIILEGRCEECDKEVNSFISKPVGSHSHS